MYFFFPPKVLDASDAMSVSVRAVEPFGPLELLFSLLLRYLVAWRV